MAVRIAISVGDPAGIGPEIIWRALAQPAPGVEYQVYGSRALISRLSEPVASAVPESAATWIDVSGIDEDAIAPGRPGPASGRLQVESLAAALDAVLEGRADALCTAPITKAAARAAGFPFPGHTEYLAQRCGAERVAMMLAGPTLRVVPLTGHVALRDVPRRMTPRLVAQGIEVTARALFSDFGIHRPRIALAALNPHAGEEGLMGDEEQLSLRPGLENARAALLGAGLTAELHGPLPADGLFAHHETFDAVVCCYHDQALIPLKMIHRDDGVNVTLGLPIVRTSPAHGSALDIAGRGLARPDSMVAALRMAAELVRRRRGPLVQLPRGK
jgi:4-hydroxythreonine-4-phosphate dehydrogenase